MDTMIPKKLQDKQFFTSIEDVYQYSEQFVRIAEKIVYDPTLAHDAFHSAIEKVLVYHRQNPTKRLWMSAVRILVRREALKLNKGYSRKELDDNHANYEGIYGQSEDDSWGS